MKTAIVLASGPSLTQEQINAAQFSGHFTIVVNSTWEKMPNANVVYAGDFIWIKAHIAKLQAAIKAGRFKGEVWSQDSSSAARWPIVHRIRGGNRDGLGKDMVYINGNSGTQAVNLAYLWGYKRIILLGFDMKEGPGGEKHHHPDHPHPCVQAMTFDEWLKKWVKVAHDLKATGIEVINCTPGSALKLFPMKDWKEVLL